MTRLNNYENRGQGYIINNVKVQGAGVLSKVFITREKIRTDKDWKKAWLVECSGHRYFYKTLQEIKDTIKELGFIKHVNHKEHDLYYQY